MTYRLIASTETDPEAPVTSALMKALDGNVAATANGEAGAPKIRRINTAVVTPALTVTFTGLGDFSGVEFDFFARRGATAGSVAPTLAYSTDNGATFSTAVNITGVFSDTNQDYFGSGNFDFETGNGDVLILRPQSTAGPTSSVAFTLAGASLAINALRFTFTLATGVVLLKPNGGTK